MLGCRVRGGPKNFTCLVDSSLRQIKTLYGSFVIIADPDVDSRCGQQRATNNRDKRQDQQSKYQCDTTIPLHPIDSSFGAYSVQLSDCSWLYLTYRTYVRYN